MLISNDIIINEIIPYLTFSDISKYLTLDKTFYKTLINTNHIWEKFITTYFPQKKNQEKQHKTSLKSFKSLLHNHIISKTTVLNKDFKDLLKINNLDEYLKKNVTSKTTTTNGALPESLFLSKENLTNFLALSKEKPVSGLVTFIIEVEKPYQKWIKSIARIFSLMGAVLYDDVSSFLKFFELKKEFEDIYNKITAAIDTMKRSETFPIPRIVKSILLTDKMKDSAENIFKEVEKLNLDPIEMWSEKYASVEILKKKASKLPQQTQPDKDYFSKISKILQEQSIFHSFYIDIENETTFRTTFVLKKGIKSVVDFCLLEKDLPRELIAFENNQSQMKELKKGSLKCVESTLNKWKCAEFLESINLSLAAPEFDISEPSFVILVLVFFMSYHKGVKKFIFNNSKDNQIVLDFEGYFPLFVRSMGVFN